MHISTIAHGMVENDVAFIFNIPRRRNILFQSAESYSGNFSSLRFSSLNYVYRRSRSRFDMYRIDLTFRALPLAAPRILISDKKKETITSSGRALRRSHSNSRGRPSFRNRTFYRSAFRESTTIRVFAGPRKISIGKKKVIESDLRQVDFRTIALFLFSSRCSTKVTRTANTRSRQASRNLLIHGIIVVERMILLYLFSLENLRRNNPM